MTTPQNRTRRHRALVAVIAAGLLVACATDGGVDARVASSVPPPPTVVGTSPSDASAGIPPAVPTDTGGTSPPPIGSSTIVAAGRPLAPALPAGGCRATDGFVPVSPGRRSLLRLPAAAPVARRAGVVVLHGYTGTPERIEQTSGWTPFGREHDAVIAYGEGTRVPSEGFAWTTGTDRYSATGADDVAYLRDLVTLLVASYCVDPARILLTGESNGGAMTVVAACDPRTTSLFRLFAPVIPAVDQHVVDRCRSGPPIRVAVVASRLDRTIPYDGHYPAGQIPLLAQEDWFLRFAAARNGCAPDGPSRTHVEDGEVIRPAGCVTLSLAAVDDGTHTWPGGPTGTGGLAPGRFPATTYLWALFASS